MGFSSAVIACFILLAFDSPIRASVVRAPDSALRGKTENFKLRITEKEENFDEEITIDEENDIEYFSVPAHNDVLAADFLFDFKMNITLARLKERGVCYLTPLPSELPKANLLKQGLREMSALPASHQIKTVTHTWRMSELVEKTAFRSEVRDFCDQYPVYRLSDYPLEPNAEGTAERVKRQLVTFDNMDLCGQVVPACGPNEWILGCRFTNSHCVYYLTCRVSVQRKRYECDANANHESGRVLCCEARCPE